MNGTTGKIGRRNIKHNRFDGFESTDADSEITLIFSSPHENECLGWHSQHFQLKQLHIALKIQLKN